MVAKLVRYEI